MAQAKKIQTAPDAFRYSPGDGHTYTWDGASTTATVYRHRAGVSRPEDSMDTRLQLERTGDTVPMDGVARTATAFMDAMDRWRAGRVTGEVEVMS